ncbi:hypothetical protein E2C01_078176 [Portunus trituberculatus]|uniref:Uncharacterized protein n=1 Tax=Portunus trituberculatus TaxID=210409 RepID=A0A5B7IM82_PORTR|nr:hypothetical protein [Portunus trituberculatus]
MPSIHPIFPSKPTTVPAPPPTAYVPPTARVEDQERDDYCLYNDVEEEEVSEHVVLFTFDFNHVVFVDI